MSSNQVNLTAFSQNFDAFGEVCEHLDYKDLYRLFASCRAIKAAVQDQLEDNPALKSRVISAFKDIDVMELARICRIALFNEIAVDVFMKRSQSAFYREPIQIGSDQYHLPTGFSSYKLQTILESIKAINDNAMTMESWKEKENLERELLLEIKEKLQRSERYRQGIDNWETRAKLLELSYSLTHKYLNLAPGSPNNEAMNLLRSNLFYVLCLGKISFERVFSTGYQLVLIAEKLLEIDPTLQIEIDYENIIRENADRLGNWENAAKAGHEEWRKRYAGACDILESHAPHKLSEYEALKIQKMLINKVLMAGASLVVVIVAMLLYNAYERNH